MIGPSPDPNHPQTTPTPKADGSISRKYGGFGLGLSIVQELVRAHGGQMWAQSSVNKGSCFTFLLPGWPDAAAAGPPTPLQPPQPPSGTNVVVAPPPALPAVRSGGGAAGGAGDASRGGDPGGDESAGGAGDPVIPREFADVPYDAAQLSALASSRPFMAADAAAAAATAAAANGGVSTAAAAVRPTYHALHGVYQILSVDDDHVNQTVMQSLMGSSGYELLMAGSGEVRSLAGWDMVACLLAWPANRLLGSHQLDSFTSHQRHS
jgi:hypothetical protein